MKEMSYHTKLSIFWLLLIILFITNNLAHPITPTFIQQLQLPDYVFGIAYSMMSFTNFFGSFLWQSLINKIKLSYIFLAALLIYALAQSGFALSSNMYSIFFFRLLAGIGSAGFMVGGLVAVITLSNEDNKGELLTLYTSIQLIAGMVGFFVGGMLGKMSVEITFLVQVIFTILNALAFFAYFQQANLSVESPKKQGRVTMSPIFWMFCISVFALALATTTFDQSFNYLINQRLQLQSDANGNFKVIVGIFTLLFNGFITVRIIRYKKVVPAIKVISLLTALACILLFFVKDIIIIFILAVIFSVFNSVLMPLQSSLLTEISHGVGAVGYYNASRSLGMILGGVVAGFSYYYDPLLPFIISGMMMIAVFIFSRK